MSRGCLEQQRQRNRLAERINQHFAIRILELFRISGFDLQRQTSLTIKGCFSDALRAACITIEPERKTIVLGVTGSIAAYKAADLASLLAKSNYGVHVVMTADALRFITPLPFKTLSRHPVITDLYDEEEGWKPTHVRLADEADLLLVAPATANNLAKLAHGLADDALTCIALALNPKAQVLVAPAMNGKMWSHPATQRNVALLKERGVEFIGPEKGMLSCGYEGLGRLWAVDKIAARALEMLSG
ncbi:MAG: phosphopantothenoylcysteine decarboxylase [Verrucomicrobia bacterium]|nr:phosphopantothenoylcysteine decarboxylase [Verrucomicrobiota bacterium]